MVKYIAYFMVFVAICYIGFSLKQIYQKKYRFYKEFCEFNQMLLDEITNYKSQLIKVIDKYLSVNKNNLSKILTTYKENLQNNIIVFENANDIIPKSLFLSKEERLEIVDFFNNLGKSSYENEVQFLKRNLDNMKIKTTKAKEDTTKKGDLYFKLSIMLGFAVILLLI